jgi:predicted RNase H-like HicB family nuclease
MNQYTAIIQCDGKWWTGWIEEIPGACSQGRTRKELLENLQSALKDIIEINREQARADVEGDFEEVRVVA